MSLQLGIDKILAQPPTWKNKRIGLLTNDAAKHPKECQREKL